MHISRLAAAVLGFWLAGSLFLYLVPTNNFRLVDQVLKSLPEPAQQTVAKLDPGEARFLLRYLASEQNRWLFDRWETIQLATGTVLVVLLLLSTTGRKTVVLFALAMLLMVAVMHWVISPELNALGRQIDFLPADAPSAERTRFWNFHNTYSTLEMFKSGLGLVTLWLLATRSRKSRHSSRREPED